MEYHDFNKFCERSGFSYTLAQFHILQACTKLQIPSVCRKRKCLVVGWVVLEEHVGGAGHFWKHRKSILNISS